MIVLTKAEIERYLKDYDDDEVLSIWPMSKDLLIVTIKDK